MLLMFLFVCIIGGWLLPGSVEMEIQAVDLLEAFSHIKSSGEVMGSSPCSDRGIGF